MQVTLFGALQLALVAMALFSIAGVQSSEEDAPYVNSIPVLHAVQFEYFPLNGPELNEEAIVPAVYHGMAGDRSDVYGIEVRHGPDVHVFDYRNNV